MLLLAPSLLCFHLPVALALGGIGSASLHEMQVRHQTEPSLVRLAADSMPSAAIQSDNPNDYVQVRGKRLVLGGKPFVIRGANYFGSWLHHSTINAGNGIEHVTIWAFYHDWDSQKVDADFRFIRSQLNATAVRIGTPAENDFASLIRYHHYQPWYNPDGTITEQYKFELTKLADIAYANGLRIQLCLLWNISNEIANDPEGFALGGRMDRLYSNQVRSIAMALRNHPGVISYSIGNEVLVKWQINGTHRSWYEAVAAGFIVRRLQDVRAAAPLQLLNTDEGASPNVKQWYAPGSEVIQLSGVETGSGLHTIRLADMVDYLGPHFYPETLHRQDLVRGVAPMIEDAKQQIVTYLRVAKLVGKPVVINEFGLINSPEALPFEQYTSIRDKFFQGIIPVMEQSGLQGLLAWDALPYVLLKPGHYLVKNSTVNSSSPIEVDIDPQDPARQRVVLFLDPRFNLFNWRADEDVPRATLAAEAIASAWKVTSP